jgi:hypothetical protein
MDGKDSKSPLRALGLSALYLTWFLTVVLMTALLWKYPYLLTGLYVAASVILVTVWWSKETVIFYFTGFVLGPIGECVAVYSGAWSYAKPDYLIPVWIPFAWALTGLFILRLSRSLLGK